MLPSIPTRLRRRAVLIASGTAVVLAVGGGTTAALAASADGTPTPSPTASCQPHVRALIVAATPKELKADLKTLRSEPKGQRAAERRVIRQKALKGTYGNRIQRVATIVAGKRAKGESVASTLPEALKSDLKTLRAAAPKSDARHAEAQKIEQKALAGDYGTAIQTRAKAVQQRVQERCAAK